MTFLGSSPITSVLGLVVICATVVSEVLTDQGIPHDAAGWFRIITGVVIGVSLRYAKDYNVSNSSKPGEAKLVPEAVQTKPADPLP